MKFLLPLLLAAAPAVMGRACKPRSRTSTKLGGPVQTPQPTVILSSTGASLPTSVPENGGGSNGGSNGGGSGPSSGSSTSVPVVVTTSITPKTTLRTSAVPATSSAGSGSGSGSDSGSGSGSDSGSDSGSGGSVDLGGSSISGSSTFYGGNLAGGTCSFTTYSLPAGIYGTAFSGQVWNSAANCGACIEITGPSGTVKAMIVDQCPECTEGHLDLFPDAFTAVGGTDGIVQTSYKFVTCGITSPIVLHNKSGTSQYWFSMQVVNSNVPIKSLEVSTDGGKTWQGTTRRDYNFFENASGFGTQEVDVRVTSTTGKSITVSKVGVASDSQFTASANF